MFDNALDQERREIGARMRRRRLELNLTQQELAEALGHKSSHRVNQIELGRQRLYAEELPRLCRILVCGVTDIVG